MRIKSVLKNKKAVSGVIAAILLIGITITAVGILVSTLDLNFDSDVSSAGAITCEDVNGDNLIDKMNVPLMNTGMTNAQIESVTVIQGDVEYLWYTFDSVVDMGEVASIDIYALGDLQQVKSSQTFNIEIQFQDNTYSSYGYVVIEEEIPEVIGEGAEDFLGYAYLIERTADDDEYGKRNFPAEIGYSPSLWFLLGEFDDNERRPDLELDYIDLCGYGEELSFQPYLLDDREFTEGNIGTQSNYKVTPYNDSGEHPGLIAIDKYGNWDKEDNLNWGKRGIVYMWTYIFSEEDNAITVNIGANGASELKVWLNEEYLLSGNKMNNWYTSEEVTINPGLNLLMVKISSETDAHFAGQILLFNSAINNQLANLYSVWPSIGNL